MGRVFSLHPQLPVLDEKLSITCVSDKMFESTSFIETQSKSETYKDHPPILISDNEEFSDITKLLENETDEDNSFAWNSWNTNTNSPYKVKLCQKEINLSLLVAGVLSVVLFLVVCVLLYRQTISDQQQADIDQKPVNSLDIILSGEN